MRVRTLGLSLLATGALSGLLGGCVYYNGMYNANRLARSARQAERDGRTLEASGLWGQVATKAESVVVRHPTSKYAEQASLLQGIALAKLGQCAQALAPLSRPAATSKSDLVEEATLAAARCQMVLGNYAAAEASFSLLVESRDPGRRNEARFHYARILRQAGRDREALAELQGLNDSRARSERLLALAGTDHLPQALALMDSLLTPPDTSVRWDSLVVLLGEKDPRAASSLVDRLRRRPLQRPELQARMLLDDGIRLAKVDTAAAARRFHQVLALGVTGEAPGRAALALLQLDLARINNPAQLAIVEDSLKKLAVRFNLLSQEIERMRATVALVHTGGTMPPDSARSDLRLFLAAEMARDALAAPRLAEALFRQIPEQWPSSPYAPKAVLAAQSLNPAWHDSARTLLDERYWDSPYLATVRGEVTPEYLQLEDSLGAYAASLATPQTAGPRRRLPGVRRPGQQPPPAADGSRVPEP
jgi:tetratricopeptide (TPR) repeat protein